MLAAELVLSAEPHVIFTGNVGLHFRSITTVCLFSDGAIRCQITGDVLSLHFISELSRNFSETITKHLEIVSNDYDASQSFRLAFAACIHYYHLW